MKEVIWQLQVLLNIRHPFEYKSFRFIDCRRTSGRLEQTLLLSDLIYKHFSIVRKLAGSLHDYTVSDKRGIVHCNEREILFLREYEGGSIGEWDVEYNAASPPKQHVKYWCCYPGLFRVVSTPVWVTRFGRYNLAINYIWRYLWCVLQTVVFFNKLKNTQSLNNEIHRHFRKIDTESFSSIVRVCHSIRGGHSVNYKKIFKYFATENHLCFFFFRSSY